MDKPQSLQQQEGDRSVWFAAQLFRPLQFNILFLRLRIGSVGQLMNAINWADPRIIESILEKSIAYAQNVIKHDL
jgi:hypothetical protein